MVFAVETLHNTYFDFNLYTREENEKFKTEKKKAIKENFSPEFEQRLNECLSHFSNPSFASRLRDLIQKGGILFDTYINDKDDFVRKVTKHRNYLAHNHKNSEEAAITSEEYPYFIAVLKMIFECSYLKILGFTDDQIQKMIKRNLIYNRNKLNLNKKI
ncbi:HEPN domain-containing protein [Ferruginibacter albus]|uniref:HEPN domain-containing protein n=1 Tax=Ferruginibacter albus TaxID=2875540 RepID=UPI0021054820|nr:HEPN domain-containing protein [Ferruginibacter albus]UAY53217.1 hypothetical protein K9M53_05985 [Ferruginibacter albus]